MREESKPIAISILIHFSIACVFLSFKYFKFSPKQNLDFIVYEQPKIANSENTMDLKAKPILQKQIKAREVFGIKRNALTQDSTSSSGVEVKKGNTLAKAQDDLKLNDQDKDLPIPTDEYLVDEMPKIAFEVKASYPQIAKSQNIQGDVVMDILIDSLGVVREVKLLKGPGYGLNEAAIEAIQKFKFLPARVQTQKVAVRIRYTYKFILEK